MRKPARPEHNEAGTSPSGEVSELLQAWTDGDRGVLDRLTPIVYDELHRLVRHYMKGERPGHSLQTTALVNEAYMRLVDYKGMQWQNRTEQTAAIQDGSMPVPATLGLLARGAASVDVWRRKEKSA